MTSNYSVYNKGKGEKLSRDEKIYENLKKWTPLPQVLYKIILNYSSNEPLFEGEIKKEIYGFRKPCGIVSDGTYIYICNSDRNEIEIINTSGEPIRNNIVNTKRKPIINNIIHLVGNTEFRRLQYSAIHESCIYIVDAYNKNIQIFTIPDGKAVRKIRCCYNYFGISIYDSHMYFCTNRCIHIYTLDGIMIRDIDIKNISKITYINGTWYISGIFVAYGKIYVTGENQCFGIVICLSLEGEYIFHLECKNKYNGLPAVYVTDKSLYIGDSKGIYQYDLENDIKFVKEWNKNAYGSITCITFVDNTCFVTAGTDCVLIL